jgi:high frequency lysogenization protein
MTSATDSAVDSDVIALAGIYQAVNLVKQVAHEGRSNLPAFRASIGSVFRFDADSAESVYGGVAGVKHGLDTLIGQLGGGNLRQDPELTAYAANLMFLERKLTAQPWMVETLRSEIQAAKGIGRPDEVEDPAVIANLAHAYSQTISRLSPRILVQGEPALLKDADVANRIRSLLLAGIRAAVLWRQVGGSRLKLLFGRKRIVRGARMALSVLGG